MQVSEIFYSLQGEGLNLGVPSVFLRLAGCHLRCVWCDSKYTWERKSGSQMEIAEVLKEIKKFPTKNLVITGGEPLLQQSALKELLDSLKNLDRSADQDRTDQYYVEMETSGSLKSYLDQYIDHYNCSPKLSNSQNVRIVLEKFPKNKTYYKFVVDSLDDLEEIEGFIEANFLDRKMVFLMPQGVDPDDLKLKSQWLAEICKEKGLRFTPRLHVNIWGAKRGV